MAYTYTWNANKPADDEKIADLGTVIRENWGSIVEGSVALDASQLAAKSSPTAIASTGFIYAKDVSAKAELHYTDEDSNNIQITSGGLVLSNKVNGAASSDLLITSTAGQDIVVKLGDNAGAQKISFTDSDDVEIARIDSDGNIQCDGTSTLAGNVTMSAAATVGTTLGVTGATTLSAAINAKVGDKGDAATAINALIPVAWSYVAVGGSDYSQGLTVSGGGGSTYTFTFSGYTPGDANYCVVVSPQAYTVGSVVTKAAGSFTVNTKTISTGANVSNQAINVVVYDK